MTKGIYLSVVATLCLQAAPLELGNIDVEADGRTEVIKDVSGEDIKSADLGEALHKQSPSVSLVRRSGIANDVIVRGQKKDNINVTIDGCKVHGACPNRMDPPISHVLTNNVDFIEINEGPYNVEDFGSLSGDVKVHTVKPKDEFSGELNLGLGSLGYKKAALILSGAITENVKFLLSTSTEKGDQYKDGDGNDFVEQMLSNAVPMGNRYQARYEDLEAFSKKTVMAKLFWDITDDQELRLSYTANRSDDILYPSTPMDALYDDSDIYDIEYTVKNLGTYSKELKLKVYQSEVDHPMSNAYRNAANMMANVTHALTTKAQGAKLTNMFEIGDHTITAGLDYTKRNWDGGFIRNGMFMMNSINDVDTKNMAFFLKDKISMDKFILDLGLRYDKTKITSEHPNATLQPDNDYSELSGYIKGTYNADKNTKYFAGLGKSSRVPDARELYIIMMGPTFVGNPSLENTINYELDIGIEKQYENASIKAKAFYSKLEDFIAYNGDTRQFENVDAKIYGFELSGTYVATDDMYFDYGMSYQRGKKENVLTGQEAFGKDLAEIPPFKFNAAVNYDWDDSLNLRAELIASDKWSNFDEANGEQALDGYAVVNLKATKQFSDDIELVVGVDNLFDKTYAASNTYKDLTLILANGGAGDVMLLNEPGRYFYTNFKYKF